MTKFIEEYEYDENGNCIEFWYDSEGHLIHFKNSKGDEFWHDYDANGKLNISLIVMEIKFSKPE